MSICLANQPIKQITALSQGCYYTSGFMMDKSGNLGGAGLAKRARLSLLEDVDCTSRTDHMDSVLRQQIGGSGNHYQQSHIHKARHDIQHSLPRTHSRFQPHRSQHLQAAAPVPIRPTDRKSESAVTDVLPFCTMEPPLRQEQVIALSDVAGSVGELVLLALGAAAGEHGCAEKMDNAVGVATARNVVDFFAGEWEVE